MTLRDTLSRHDLTPETFAAIVRVTPSTVYKWLRGVHPTPHMVTLLLDAWERCPEALAESRNEKESAP